MMYNLHFSHMIEQSVYIYTEENYKGIHTCMHAYIPKIDRFSDIITGCAELSWQYMIV